MKNEDFLNSIKNSLDFNFQIGNPNFELLKIIFDKAFISENYNRFNQDNENNENNKNKKDKNKNDKNNKNKNNKNKKFDYIINPNKKDILKGKDKVYLFTFDYFIDIGILLELTNGFFTLKNPQFKRILNNLVKDINKNIKALNAKKDEFGFSFINNLSILYVKIKDIIFFILNAELYGEAKSLSRKDLKNLMEISISNVSTNTSDIVGHFYEDSVLFYFLKHSNINSNNILPRLLLYMNFIILKINKKKICIEFVPFNKLRDDKSDAFNEIDFCFYTENEIQIPMYNMSCEIFKYSLVYDQDKNSEKSNNNPNLIFPSKTLTFFELKNNVLRVEDDKKTIDFDKLLKMLETFISKIPIYIGLYKSKNFINEDCNKVKLNFFNNHQFGKIVNLNEAKKKIKEIVEDKLKNYNVSIVLEIIFGSKKIQSINYFDLILESHQMKESYDELKEKFKNYDELKEKFKNYDELKEKVKNYDELKERVKNLEKKLESYEQLNKIRIEYKEKQEQENKENKKVEIIELDEKKEDFNQEIKYYENKFKGSKLEIFKKVVDNKDFIEIIKSKENGIKMLSIELNKIKVGNILNKFAKKKIIKKLYKKMAKSDF